ncbi:hypothetical protein VZG28_10915 [Synechococcus elongatus IITB4]|uniref:hypothetical protein n=1 Tax=Synechococcus elongatus TaxID=32046 RepID=UPI0030D53A1B
MLKRSGFLGIGLSFGLGFIPAIATAAELAPLGSAADLEVSKAITVEAAEQPLSTEPILQAQADPASPTDAATAETTQLLPVPPSRLFNLETANQLPAGKFDVSAGFRWFFEDSVPGSGLQVFIGDVQYGVNDKLQIGFGGFYFDDSLAEPIAGGVGGTFNGQFFGPGLRLGSIGPSAKYQVYKSEDWAISVAGSLELLRVFRNSTPGLFGQGGEFDSLTLAGALQVPITYTVSPEFQLTLNPGVSFFPESVGGGGEFYGTYFNIGAGFNFQPVRYVGIFSDINVPLGPGGNAVQASTGAIEKAVVWSSGLRINPVPELSLDFYATNAFGTTLATRSLAFIPGSSQVALGTAVTVRF